MRILMGYPWPGNVRELKSAIECALISCKNSVIQVEDLPPELIGPPTFQPSLSDQPLDDRERFMAALKNSNGNRTNAARLLGVSRATFYRRLADLNLNLDS
jgi:transcriptional regulator of acetoin/glycerol metabolism